MYSRNEESFKAVNAKLSFSTLRIIVGFCLVLCSLVTLAWGALFPEASNTDVYSKKGLVVDASHSDQGYVMIYRESKKEQKMRISNGKSTMTYDLNGTSDFEVFPLHKGDGKYKVEVFEHVSGKKYSPVASVSFSAKLEDPYLPYLYPNQYVSYIEESTAIAKANEICANATTDAEKMEAVYQFVVQNVVYDYNFAAEVGKGMHQGYIPYPDNTLESQKGVCFDISALMSCMLRSQGVPTQLVIGYADKTYHAWNNVLIDGAWQHRDATVEICRGQVKKYTPERAY